MTNALLVSSREYCKDLNPQNDSNIGFLGEFINYIDRQTPNNPLCEYHFYQLCQSGPPVQIQRAVVFEVRDSYRQLKGSEFIPGAAERFKRAVYEVIILIETSSAEDSTFNQSISRTLLCSCAFLMNLVYFNTWT